MESFQKNMKGYSFTFLFPSPGKMDFITNYLLFRKWLKKGKLKKFDVVHINNWENFMNIPPKSKRKGQVWICQSHGFHLGLNDRRGLEDSTFTKRVFGRIFSFFVSNKIRRGIKRADIVYAAIPNILSDLKKIRKDAMWLPNPLNLNVFYPRKKVFVKGNPSVFFPTRLHKMKTPEIGFRIFSAIKKNFPKAKLHLIRYPARYSQYNYYKKLIDKFNEDIIWHDFMPRAKLPAFYSSFDIILGSFGKGLLSLVELEAMACGATVVAHDDYEIIKMKPKDLPNFAVKLLKNKKFKSSYTKKCMEYVRRMHNPARISAIHEQNIALILK